MVDICDGASATGEDAFHPGKAILLAGDSYQELDGTNEKNIAGEDSDSEPEDDTDKSDSEHMELCKSEEHVCCPNFLSNDMHIAHLQYSQTVQDILEDWEVTPEPEQADWRHRLATQSTSRSTSNSRSSSSKSVVGIKRSHESTDKSSVKRRAGVAAQALQGIEATMAALPQALSKAMNPDSPISRCKVLGALVKEDWLLPQQKVALSVLFCKDTALCDQYIAWASDPDLRRMWMETLLDTGPAASAPIPPPIFDLI
jgi:hypothetical protein